MDATNGRPPGSLEAELHLSRPLDSPAEEAWLNLVRTHDALQAEHLRLFRSLGITPAQYNVLRILRGAGADGLPCQAIGERMVTRVPDVTRLVDRLVAAGLAARERDSADRRVVRVHLSAQGKSLLLRVDRPLRELQEALFAGLDAGELRALSGLLCRLRSAGR